jgi:excisionase family DNA binding protein
MMTLPDPHETPTLTVEEAASALGIGRSAAYEAARRGEIPTLSIGRRLLVPTAALYRMLDLVPLVTSAGADVN